MFIRHARAFIRGFVWWVGDTLIVRTCAHGVKWYFDARIRNKIAREKIRKSQQELARLSEQIALLGKGNKNRTAVWEIEQKIRSIKEGLGF